MIERFAARTRLYRVALRSIEHVKYWNEKFEKYTSEVRLLDESLLAKYALIKQYVHNLSAILSAIESTVLPCTFDELVKYGLDDLSRPPAETD